MPQHTDTRQVREQIDRTAHAVALGHNAYLLEALDGVSWIRRGLLGRLTTQPLTEPSPASAA